MKTKTKSTFGSQKGLMGIRPILILAVLGAFAAWACYKGYVKWKGPNAAVVAERAKDDLSDSLKKLNK